jgi:Rrf2 family protein
VKLITRETDYAIRALGFIARNKQQLITVDELVKALHIPRPFLRKLLQILTREHILRSYKGRGGGFLLALPAEKILLYKVIEIFQGPISINECFFKKDLCPNRAQCSLRKKISTIESYVIRELKGISLASLLH